MTAEEKQKLVTLFNEAATLLRLLNGEVQTLAKAIDSIAVDAGVPPSEVK